MPDLITIDDRVRKLIGEHLGVPIEKVTDDADLVDDLGADSLDPIEISMAVEQEFGVEVPDDAEWHTVGDVLATVREQR